MPFDHDEAALVVVVLDQRERLLLVQVEAAVDRVGRVVGTLLHVATAHVADPRARDDAGGGVVGAAVAAAPGAPRSARARSRGARSGRARRRSAVRRRCDRAPRPVRSCAGSRRGCSRGCWRRAPQALVDQADHDLVADEPAGVHHLLGHHAELGTFAHGRAQHVAGRDVRYDEVPGQSHALRALAGTLSPEDDEAGAGDHAGPTSGIPRSCAASAGCRSGASVRAPHPRRSALPYRRRRSC